MSCTYNAVAHLFDSEEVEEYIYNEQYQPALAADYLLTIFGEK